MELFEHNRIAYESVSRIFSSGVLRTCVVHPTGTGKSYIALQLIEDNREKRILYVTSLNINLDAFEEAVRENIKVETIDFSLYSSIENYGDKQYDIIILDEFHRAGATDWSKGLSLVLSNNPNALILGLSATPIRYLDSARNMAEELFDGNIASEITLKDALVKKLLPIPHYMTAVYSFEDEIKKYEKMLKYRSSYKKKAERLLAMAKQNIELAEGLDKFFQENMKKPHGKYIVFCRNIEHLESMMEEAEDWFSWIKEKHFYKVYAALDSIADYQDFLDDDSDSLRLLFCVDMLNEGIHIERIDGCIMLRPTTSLNVYFQQLGRVLTVCAGASPEVFDIVHNSYSLEPVKHFWGEVRDEYMVLNPSEDNMEIFSIYSRDVAIIKLLEEFEEAMGDSWMYYYGLCEKYYKDNGNLDVPLEYRTEGHVLYQWVNRQRNLKRDNQLPQDKIDLLDLLKINWEFQIDRSMWNQKFDALVQYKEEHGDLNVVRGYVTDDGFALGMWCKSIRNQYKSGSLSQNKIDRLNEIGFEWSPISAEIPQRWMNGYKALKKFVEETGTTLVPYDYIQDDFKLGQWIGHIRLQYRNQNNPDFKKAKLNEAQIKLLDDIGFAADKADAVWEEMYLQAKRYYEGKEQPTSNLLNWITRQKNIRNGTQKGLITEERIAKLDAIGFEWSTKKELFDTEWERCYNLAKEYYDIHGVFPMSIPGDEDYDRWCRNTRNHNYRLSEEKIALLDAVGIQWPKKLGITEDTTAAWERNFEELYDYWKKNGTSKLPVGYKSKAGYNLYSWALTQRAKRIKTEENRASIEAGEMKLKLEKMLSDYQIQKLDEIDFDWGEKYRSLYG